MDTKAYPLSVLETIDDMSREEFWEKMNLLMAAINSAGPQLNLLLGELVPYIKSLEEKAELCEAYEKILKALSSEPDVAVSTTKVRYR